MVKIKCIHKKKANKFVITNIEAAKIKVVEVNPKMKERLCDFELEDSAKMMHR